MYPGKRSISPIIAVVVMTVVAIVMAVLFISYVYGVWTSYSSAKGIVVLSAKYFYFTQKPSSILNQCNSPPCGLVLMHVVAGGHVKIVSVEFRGFTWNFAYCSWKTTRPGYLDPGDNIILLRNPSLAPPCIVVSKDGNYRLYSWYEDILAKNGDLSLLSYIERQILYIYSDLTVRNPTVPQWLVIVMRDSVYKAVVQPVVIAS